MDAAWIAFTVVIMLLGLGTWLLFPVHQEMAPTSGS